MTGSEYIAEFLFRMNCRHVFTLTGGACAFMVDAVGRHKNMNLVCFQNEQAAAMAADAVWRVSRRVGVTMATSGPGATNLITGIACSYFDSIPTLHITGQVNQRESSDIHGANVRQSGFQETKIVEMVRPIVKYAVMVRSVDELRDELLKAYTIAISGRMGPVLIDVPMDIQQAEIEAVFPAIANRLYQSTGFVSDAIEALNLTLKSASRPVVLWGGGIALAGVEQQVSKWLTKHQLPFVASWAGLGSIDARHPNFLGQVGVYGNRGANYALQNSDAVVVFGSRLDNRQRSGNSENFAVGATVHVFDIDGEELKKYGGRYRATELDLAFLPDVLRQVSPPALTSEWISYLADMRNQYRGKETSSTAVRLASLSPYEVVRRLNTLLKPDAIVAADTGAALCWLYQAFEVRQHCLFTAGGNSPMGYSLCAAIGAKLAAPGRQVVSYIGDGGFQLNIQELQTIKHLNLDIIIIIMNNSSYGIIKQFQDSYLGSRYTASSDGYSVPDFGKVANAYGLNYARIERLEDLIPNLFNAGATVVEVVINNQTLIEPKLEMGRPINDQYPYVSNDEYHRGNKFVDYPRPEKLKELLAEMETASLSNRGLFAQ